ncbi:MAG: hypothetical protein NVV57_07440 [Demequina sp.]|jgi:hypothetical protein|nr:hypothetical protein [Demequina sp.]
MIRGLLGGSFWVRAAIDACITVLCAFAVQGFMYTIGHPWPSDKLLWVAVLTWLVTEFKRLADVVSKRRGAAGAD